MLIKTKYIDCASKSVFNTWKLPTSAADTSGDIYWSAIVYIQDTGEVWTHGKLYGGFFSNADSNKVSLTMGGTTKILALDGHVQSYTTLTGSGTTADQAILSTGVANKWTLKTLGKNAFSNVDYLPADATAVAAEKVVNAMRFQYNGKDMHSFDGSAARLLNIIQGDNVFITGDSQGNVTIAADPGSDTVNTAGATNLIDKKLFLIGAESQTTSPQTYSNQYVYIGADNKLYSDGKVVSTGDHTHNYAGATTPGGPALKVALNPSGLLDATYGSYGGILQDSNNGPVTDSWSNRIKILHNNSSGYYTELAQAMTGRDGLWHRRNVAGIVSDWTPVIDKANFRTYLDATYVIRGNNPNVLTNYVRYSIASGLTMNWEAGNETPTHIWGAKNSDSSKAYVFNGNNIRKFANAVNRAGDTMTGTLKVTEIQATGGNALIMYYGTNWTYLGQQAGTTYIRSGEADLQHRYNGTDYKIWDARNLVGLRTEHSHNTINFINSRDVASTPQEHGAGVWLDFKANAKANLTDGGTYVGLLTVRKYGDTTDWTGGKSAQLGFTDNSNLWVRFGTGTAWEAWQQLATTTWSNGKFLPLAGGRMTGSITISTDSAVQWSRNTDYAKIHFKNTEDTDTDSYLGFETGDNGNEYFKFSGKNGSTATQWMSIKAGGVTAPAFIKSGSSDSYVLLGGGGHKALSNFVYASGSLGVQESTGTSDNISRAQFWRDNNLYAYGVTLSHSDRTGYKTKIYHDYDNGGNLYMKSCSNGTWGSVYTIWNSGNFNPATKVSKSGDTMTGKLNWSMNGVASSIGSENGSYTQYNTNASSGHWFNKNVYSAGNFYGGSSYNRILPFKDEINSQVGGSKSAQMSWSSWSTDSKYGGAIQIREYGNVTNNQSAWSYSPAISFNWGNRYAKRFGMRSDGQFAVDDVPISLSTHNHNSLYVTALGTNGNYLTWTKNGTANNITVPYATNSDKLDGYHANGLFTGLSNSGNNISISIGGTTKTLTVGYASSAGSATTATYLPYQDTRSTNYTPYQSGFNTKGWSATHIKQNTTDGLSDGGTYHSSIYVYPWANSSGGHAHNLAFTDNGNMWMRHGTSSWSSWVKVYTSGNINPVDKTLLKKTRVPGEVIDFYVYRVGDSYATNTDYTTFKNLLFDSSGRGKSSVTYYATYSYQYTVDLSDFVLCSGNMSGYSNGAYMAGAGEIETNRVGGIAGANSKTISGLEMPKHAHWFGRYRSDNANDRDVFGPDGNQNWSTNGTSSAGQGGNWRTGYSGSGQSKDWRPRTVFVFKMIYAPKTW